MLSPSVVQNVIEAGLASGADFCEIYVEETLAHTLQLKSSLTDYISGKDKGAGIRLFYDKHELYTYTNLLDEKNLLHAVKNLTLLKKRPAKKKPIAMDPPLFSFKKSFPASYQPGEQDTSKKLLQKLDKELRIFSTNISQCIFSLSHIVKTVQIANSDGLWTVDIRPRRLFGVNCIAEHQGQKEIGYNRIGLTGERVFFEEELKKATLESGKVALNNLRAEAAPAGVFPVIINNGFGGVIFHEACGHGMETTSVAENISIFSDKLGKRVAPPCVNAYDDGTLKGEYGYIDKDDEGNKAQKTVLIEKGILKNYMTDKLGSKKTRYGITGSARRENYKYPPTSRMRNTYIAAGTSSLEEMIKDVDYGIFAETLGGGSVTPGTGNYNFTITSARLIKNGRLDKPIKGASLIGNGLDTLSKIKKVGQDMQLSPGHCGSISGWVPVTVGQPPVLVSELTVGGHI